MNAIRSFSAAFCVSAIILGALYMLCPDGNFNRPVKFAFCICFLCSILSFAIPIKNQSLKIDTDTALTENADISIKEAELIFERALKSENLTFKKIEVFADKNKDGSITISKVKVVTNENEQKIREVIGNPDYYEVEVTDDG